MEYVSKFSFNRKDNKTPLTDQIKFEKNINIIVRNGTGIFCGGGNFGVFSVVGIRKARYEQDYCKI